jgi:hypothetical protein
MTERESLEAIRRLEEMYQEVWGVTPEEMYEEVKEMVSDHDHESDLVLVCRHLADGERHDWRQIGSTPEPDEDSGWVCTECAELIMRGPSGDAEHDEKVTALLITLCRTCAAAMRRRSASRN